MSISRRKTHAKRAKGPLLWGGIFLLLALGLPNSGRVLTWLNQPRPDLNEPAADPAGTMLLALLPFSFVENRGQWNADTKFQARKLGLTVRLEPTAIVLECTEQAWHHLKGAVVRLAFEHGSADAELKGQGPSPGRHHFFLGNRPAQWFTGIPGYRRVRYDDLYDDIDLRVQEQRDRFEYDWILEPGADLAKILIRVEGATHLELTEDGSLRLHTAVGPIDQMPPNAWYELPSGHKRLAKAMFVIQDNTHYGFEVAERDPQLPLVINPGIEATGFLHMAAGERPVVMTDAGETAVIAGRSRSLLAPRASQVFVTRVNLADDSLMYSTSLGGDGDAIAHSVIADSAGDVDVGGWTNSLDFPTIPAASKPDPSNFFVVWLDPSGNVRMLSKPPSMPSEDQKASVPKLTGTPSIVPPAIEEPPAMTIPQPATPPRKLSLTVMPYGSSSPPACDPLRLEVSDALDGDKLMSIRGIPEDAGALIVVSQSERNKRILGSTVLIARSEMLMSMPVLTDPATGRAELSMLALLRHVLTPGRTVYLQAFSSGCSFTAPFRASNALAVRATERS